MKIDSGRRGRLARLTVLSSVVVFLVVVGGALVTPASWADDVESIVSRGVELRRTGRDRDALAEFQRALKIQKAPRILAQVALAEQALGLWTDAEEHLSESLSDASDPWIKKNRATLGKALAVIQSHIGTLEVWGTPAGADILVNDKVVGKLPLARPLRVAGESMVLKVRADGYVEFARSIRVPATENVREHVDLAAVSRTPVADAAAVGREPAAAARAVDPSTAVPATRAATTSTSTGATEGSGSGGSTDGGGGGTSLRPFAWIAAAGALAGVAFGAVETFVALGKRSEFEDHMGPNPASPGQVIKDCGTASLSSACRSIQSDYQRGVTLAIVGYGVGGALAIGSAVLFVLSSRDDRRTESAVACLPDPFNQGLSCRLHF